LGVYIYTKKEKVFELSYLGAKKIVPFSSQLILEISRPLFTYDNTTFHIKRAISSGPELQVIAFHLSMHNKVRKRQSEALSRKKRTVIKNIHKLGQFSGIDVALVIRQNGQYTTYQSIDKADFPPSKEQIVSRPLDSIDKSS
jgi:hypothetical protein